MPRNKAAEALTTASTVAAPHWAMLAGLRTHALRILGDGDRDLDDVVMEVDSESATCALFLGKWRGLVRMAAALTVQHDEAEIVLIVTKGTTQVDLQNPQFGQTGPGIGNSILVAATFHVALFYLRASGIRFMTNHPVDQRVRDKYTLMGFVNGERLDLNDAKALEKAFGYVEAVYKQRSLTMARPPLPL